MNKLIQKLRDSEEKMSVNITSMVDVIFILLIFFMLSTQFKKSSLPLDLPQVQDSQNSIDDVSEKTISVSKNEIQLDGKEIRLEDLELELKNLYDQNPELEISLECEKTLDFETVVQVLSKVQNAGISKIGILNEAMDN